MDIHAILQAVATGEMSPDAAADQLRDLPFEDIGFARIDHHRKLRTGAGEVIFAQGKTPAQTAEIFARLSEHGPVLATRATQAHFDAVSIAVPDAVYHETARCITYEPPDPPARRGGIAICSGGTADMPVAEEAAVTAGLLGANVTRLYDVGVAGLHRLLNVLPQIHEANVIVAVAGMEGALPSVVAGLCDKPVIAVPTSVGYGANLGGISALLTMINSCSAGISVVNIDNGFGAGFLAARISNAIEDARGN